MRAEDSIGRGGFLGGRFRGRGFVERGFVERGFDESAEGIRGRSAVRVPPARVRPDIFVLCKNENICRTCWEEPMISVCGFALPGIIGRAVTAPPSDRSKAALI